MDSSPSSDAPVPAAPDPAAASDPLTRPWAEVLQLSPRIAKVLEQQQIRTMGELQAALTAASRPLLGPRGLSHFTLRWLQRRIDEWQVRFPPTQPSPPSTEHSHQTSGMRSAEATPTALARLEVPWQDWLQVSIRVEHVLEREGFRTLREVSEAAQDERLLRCRNFGRTSLRDLRRGLDRIVPVLMSMTPSNPTSETAPLDQEQARPTEVTSSLRERLGQQGVAELPTTVLSRRLQPKLLHVERLHGPQTLSSLADLLPGLLRCQHIGRGTLAQLRGELEQIASSGMNSYLFGSPDPPANLAELVTAALAALTDRERPLVVGRLLERRTLEALAIEQGVTRERIRQRVGKSVADLQRRYGEVARTLAEPLLRRLREAGGLLHCDDLDLQPPLELGPLLFALALAGQEEIQVWHGEFLSELTLPELLRRTDLLRQALRSTGRPNLPIAEVQELVAETAGLRLPPHALLRHLALALKLPGTLEQGVDLARFVGLREQLVELLRAARRPLHLTELAAVCRAADPAAIAWEADEEQTEDEGAETPLETASADEPITTAAEDLSLPRRIEGLLTRTPEVYWLGHGTYVHETGLPVPRDRLAAAADRSVQLLAGEPGAVSTVFLLQQLEQSGMTVPGLNPHLLKDALSRRPEIVPLRKLMVGYAATFREHGLTLDDRLQHALLQATRPLSWLELHDQLHRQGATYSTTSLQQRLAAARDSAIYLGDGRYVHMQRLGLSPLEQYETVQEALRLLGMDGSSWTASWLLRRLNGQGRALALAGRDDGSILLWGLLRNDPRCEAGANQLVRQRREEERPGLLPALLVQVLGELQVAFPRELRRAVQNRRLYQGSDHSIDAALQDCYQQGLVRRLPPSLYFVAARTEEVLPALVERVDLLQAALGQPELGLLAADELELLAQVFYRSGRAAEARQVLTRLLERADPDPARRRRTLRLKTALEAREEE